MKDGVTDEFGTAIRAQKCRSAMHTHQSSKNVDDAGRANATGDVDGEAFVRKFVDYGQAL